MKRPLVARRSPVLLGASRPILLETVVLFVMAILIREQLPYTSSSASKSNAMNDSIMVVNAMSTASARTTRRGTTSPSMPLPLPVPEPVPEPVPVRSAQDHHAVIPPPRLPLTPPFPNGLCGGTIVDIAPEETFGVDVNLANFNFMGDMVLLPRTIQIWLPPGYEDGDNSNNNNNGNGNDNNDNDGHPVLYVHDGQNALEDEESWTGASWRLIGALTRLADHKLICTSSPSSESVVGTSTTHASSSSSSSSSESSSESYSTSSASSSEKLPIVVLLPSAEGDWLPGVRRRHLEYGDMNFPFAQAHADFVANTVKPLVDNRFRTDPSAERTFCMGSSMGGQASLHLLLRHPDKFGGAACLSPAFGPAILNFVDSPKGRQILRGGKKKLYFDIGGDMPTDDSNSSDFVRVSPIDVLDHLTPVHGWNPGYFWLDTQLQGQVAAMQKALDRAGIDHEYRQYPGGRHNERAWALRIDKPLLHLFSNNNNNNNNNSNNHKQTVKPSFPTGAYDIRLWNLFPAPEGGNYKTTGEAYWRQVQAFLWDWKDAAVYPPDPSDHHTYTTDWMVRKSSEYRGSYFGNKHAHAHAHAHAHGWNKTKTSGSGNRNHYDAYHLYPRLALERAAEAGHPMAQHYLANAHSSGIWPVPATGGGDDHVSYSSSSPRSPPLVEDLHVFDEWLPSSGEHTQQIDKAYLLWHMAALGGNLESAIALANRLDETYSLIEPAGNNGGRGTTSSSNQCEDSLPYYQAAADGIIDQLEVSEHSRAKVIPPMDKHTLAQVHMHGGTSSQLDWNNKPDESKEAIQFYHLKATTIPWSMKKKASTSSSTSEDKKNNRKKKKTAAMEQEESPDILAAYTLAHMHHYGVRGVEQNLTKSLQYYEIAGTHGHWESAGHACSFHLWGIGTEQNAKKAMEFCKIGAPFGYEGCRRMHEKDNTAKNNNNNKPTTEDSLIVKCDDNALNGMGLLHLLGVRGLIDPDRVMAEKYFTLAKESGSVEAYYNLAMMWLGWKTHFKTITELKQNGFTPDGKDGQMVLPIPGQTKTKTSSDKYVLYKAGVGDNAYYKGPIQNDVENAIKMLNIAAKLGHVQAKHRLGSIYATGLNRTTSVIQYNFVKRDCGRAKEHFKWIVSNASPTRSKRLRTAYKEYIAGNLEISVRNYLAAAEVGSIVGQVNAAFLMERGVCLGLGAADCAKAAVRMWKAAAAKGNAEACLRVGDFYYYGRMHGERLHNGPFGWIQYLLLPEKYLPALLRAWGAKLLGLARNGNGKDTRRALESSTSASETTCESTEEGTCRNDHETHGGAGVPGKKNLDHEMEEDLHTAAHYYQIAGEKHLSARANFNLGFMHQWGLGLKQDFPMAKRHYDLALDRNYVEAEIAVQVALIAMNTHEFVIRCKVLIEDWWYKRVKQKHTTNTNAKSSSPTITTPSAPDATASSPPQPQESVPRAPKHTSASGSGGRPQGPDLADTKTREEVMAEHVFDRSSMIILMLFVLLLIVQSRMYYLGRPQRLRQQL